MITRIKALTCGGVAAVTPSRVDVRSGRCVMFFLSPGREERTPRINPVAGPPGGHPLGRIHSGPSCPEDGSAEKDPARRKSPADLTGRNGSAKFERLPPVERSRERMKDARLFFENSTVCLSS